MKALQNARAPQHARKTRSRGKIWSFGAGERPSPSVCKPQRRRAHRAGPVPWLCSKDSRSAPPQEPFAADWKKSPDCDSGKAFESVLEHKTCWAAHLPSAARTRRLSPRPRNPHDAKTRPEEDSGRATLLHAAPGGLVAGLGSTDSSLATPEEKNDPQPARHAPRARDARPGTGGRASSLPIRGIAACRPSIMCACQAAKQPSGQAGREGFPAWPHGGLGVCFSSRQRIR